MAWKSKYRSSWSYGYSSGDEPSTKSGGNNQSPAKSVDEALWRAARRVSATWRWLSTDLALLAQDKQHADLLLLLASSLRMIGKTLLPHLGHMPLGAEVSERPEVVELVSILACLPAAAAKPVEQNVHVASAEKPCTEASRPCTADVKVQKVSICSSKSVQTSGDFMVRAVLQGEWVPLDCHSFRRGGIVKCTKEASTDNAHDAFNLTLYEGHLCKLVDRDVEGDIRMVALTDAGTHNLYCPSKRHWLLKDSFDKFSIHMPPRSCSANAQHIRDVRSRNVEEDA